MREMLFVGRGGEGVVLASQVFAETLGRAGLQVQAFPEFTAERRGAPIAAYVRWDDAPIRRRYKMRDCDVLAVVSPSPPSAETVSRIRPGGLLVLNAERRRPVSGAFHVARVPASRIARERGVLSTEGRPMGNVALLGACIRLLAPDALGVLEGVVRARFADADRNVAAARDGYERCTAQHRMPDDVELQATPVRAAVRPRFPVSTRDSLGNATGAWSLERPVVTSACTACGVCALFCPDGAMSRVDGAMVVDEVHCKGCGICVDVCPVRDAIAMEQAAA